MLSHSYNNPAKPIRTSNIRCKLAIFLPSWGQTGILLYPRGLNTSVVYVSLHRVERAPLIASGHMEPVYGRVPKTGRQASLPWERLRARPEDGGKLGRSLAGSVGRRCSLPPFSTHTHERFPDFLVGHLIYGLFNTDVDYRVKCMDRLAGGVSYL